MQVSQLQIFALQIPFHRRSKKGLLKIPPQAHEQSTDCACPAFRLRSGSDRFFEFLEEVNNALGAIDNVLIQQDFNIDRAGEYPELFQLRPVGPSNRAYYRDAL